MPANYYTVRKLLLYFIALFSFNNCVAQQVVERKARLTSMVTERYQTVIQTNKQVRQGFYHAFYGKKIVIANGKYTNDKKTGNWYFFGQEGKQLQNYNYDENRLTYEAPEEPSSNFVYIFDEKITNTTLATIPVRPGGRYYGYVPYLQLFKLPRDMDDINRDAYTVVLELLVSPLGRLADYKIHLKSGDYDRVINVNTDLLNEEDRLFIPATWEKQPVSSRIFIECYINRFDGIDM